MIAARIYGNNRLIRKTVVRAFPPCFAAMLTATVVLMLDTLLAGALLGKEAIAAVAIGNPIANIFQALVQTITNGAAVELTVCVGRSQKEKASRLFAQGISGTLLLASAAILLCLTLAEPLVVLFGGSSDPVVANQAAWYLRACVFSLLFLPMNQYLGKVLAVYGHQKATFIFSLGSISGNLLFSVLFVKLLPAEIAVAGLGIGTSLGGLCANVVAQIIFKLKKVPLKFRLCGFTFKEAVSLFKHGFSTSGNNLADGMASGVINNMILTAFGGSAAALAVYTAVKSVISFSLATAMATNLAAAPLFGILYGARDKNGIRRTLREGYIVGLVASVLWCGVLIALLPLLEKFYGMQDVPDFRSGVYFCMLFIPLILGVRIITQMFESIEKPLMGALYSVIPDSLIYPLVLALLLPVMGYQGIWIAFSANALPFLAGLYLVRSVKLKTFRPSIDRVLCLDENIRSNVPMLDISIRSSNTDVSGISEQVHSFLQTQEVSGRTAYMTALCLEELAADFVAHAEQQDAKAAAREIMDIKLFSDEEMLRVTIRGEGKPYNPLDFQLDSTTFAKVGVKMAQKVSRRIEYGYMLGLNVVTIELNKQ